MKKKKMIRIMVLVAVLAAGATMGVAAKNSNMGSIKVMTSTLVFGDITQTVEVSGNIASDNVKAYYAGVSAPVLDVPFEEGDFVKKSDTLLTYETEDLERSMTTSNLTAAAAKSGYQGTVAQSNEMKQAYVQALETDALYKELYDNKQSKINDLTQSIEESAWELQDNIDAIKEEAALVEIKIAQKNAKAADLDDKDAGDYAREAAELNIVLASLREDMESLERTGATPEQNRILSEAQAELEEIQRQRSLLSQDMMSTKYASLNADQKAELAKQVELAEKSNTWNEEEYEKAKMGVTADFDGVISEVLVDTGAVVTEGTKLFTIKSSKDVKAEVKVSKYDIANIEIGQKAVIEVAGNEYEGMVSKIRQEAVEDTSDKTKIIVEVKIDKTDDMLYLGIEADVCIDTQKKESILLLPKEALYTDDDGDYCYSIEEGIIAKKYIETGIESDTHIELVGGIDENAVVIIDSMTDDKIGKRAH